MNELRKAANMALNALEFNLPVIEDFGSKEQLTDCHRAIMALYKTLSQPEQTVANKSDCGHKTYEPLCQMCRSTKQPEQDFKEKINEYDDLTAAYLSGLYDGKKGKIITLHQPVKQWVGLTDEDWHNLPSSDKKGCERDAEIFDWIEAKLKEKNA